MIEAAGGLVWRLDADGELQLLLVHRPRYDDWSFPKGKLHRGESHLDAALREVSEETGLDCVVGRQLADTRYRDRKGRRKRVRYWMMTPARGSFRPNPEVDRIRWMAIGDVAHLLTYRHDARLVHVVPAVSELTSR